MSNWALPLDTTSPGACCAEITDDTGKLLLVFQGRPKIPGIDAGARLIVEGMVTSWRRQLAILNPDYELISE